MENPNAEEPLKNSNENIDNIEESEDTTTSKRHIDWGIATAILFGAFFMIISFLATLAELSSLTVSFSFFLIAVSSLILFVAGVQLWRDHKDFGFDLNSKKFRKKYYMMIVSLIVYLVGILTMIIIYHSDILIEITYVLVFPILIITINHFNLLFETSTSSDLNKVEKTVPKPTIELENKLEKYKLSFILPVVLGVIGSIILFIFPWYSFTANGFADESYLSCYPTCSPTSFTNLYTTFYNFQNAGLSRFVVYFVMLLIIISGAIVYLSYSKKSPNYLRIGMILSTITSIIVILGILTVINYLIYILSNSYPPILYYSLEGGFIVGFLLFFFSTAIAINARTTMKKLVSINN